MRFSTPRLDELVLLASQHVHDNVHLEQHGDNLMPFVERCHKRFIDAPCNSLATNLLQQPG